MRYVIIPLLVLIIITVIAFLFRRKHITEIGKLEHEKLQIQNKPILEEMTKVKQLNMTGETEEKFERWRNEWTEIMDIRMPKIDSLLFDAEDMVDRFRFAKATKTEKEIKEQIHSCDKKMNEILEELNELIGSEEKNRIEMEQLKEQHRAARKTVLAHQHSFGRTAAPIEKELESFYPKFEEYDELTTQGNYLLARETVISLSEKGSRLFSIIHQVPSLLADLQTKIPSILRELRNGSGEMAAQGYYIEHLELKKNLKTIDEELESLLQQMSELQVEMVQEKVNEINDQIDSYYDALENEVNARHYVESQIGSLSELLTQAKKVTHDTSNEAAFVQQSYRLDEKEAQLPQNALKKLEQIDKQFDVLAIRLEENGSSFSSLQEEMKTLADQLEEIIEEQEVLANSMKSLRIDEHRVRTKLEELARQLQNTERLLHKGNIPGVPGEMEARLEEADEQIYIVSQSLEEVPLNMALVDSYLDNAEKAVEEVTGKVEELLENVVLIEWIIQYGNRYRASHPETHAKLLEAEESFRQFRYMKALEEAATAVEEVEPGAMKKIEELVKEQV